MNQKKQMNKALIDAIHIDTPKEKIIIIRKHAKKRKINYTFSKDMFTSQTDCKRSAKETENVFERFKDLHNNNKLKRNMQKLNRMLTIRLIPVFSASDFKLYSMYSLNSVDQ